MTYQPLKFVTDKKLKTVNQEGGENHVIQLIVPNDRLLPFQITRASAFTDFAEFRLMQDGFLIADLTDKIDIRDTDIFYFPTTDIFVYYGGVPFMDDYILPLGNYYLEVEDGATTYYSEDFKILDLEECKVLEIKYRHKCKLDGLFYATKKYDGQKDYYSKIYLLSDIQKPEYEREIDGEENAIGETVVDYEKLRKDYFIEFIGAEFMVDAFQLLQMHSEVIVTDKRGRQFKALTKNTESEWTDTYGLFGKVNFQFTPKLIIAGGCCNDESDAPVNYCLITDIEINKTIPDYANTNVNFADEYLEFAYVPAGPNQLIPFENDELVLIRDVPYYQNGDNSFKLHRVEIDTVNDTKTYVNVDGNYSKGDTLTDLRRRTANTAFSAFATYKPYYFYSGDASIGWLSNTVIDSITVAPSSVGATNMFIRGKTFKDGRLEVYAVRTIPQNGGQPTQSIETYLGDANIELFNGNGTSINIPPFTSALKLVHKGINNCIIGTVSKSVIPEDQLDGLDGLGNTGISYTFVVGGTVVGNDGNPVSLTAPTPSSFTIGTSEIGVEEIGDEQTN